MHGGAVTANDDIGNLKAIQCSAQPPSNYIDINAGIAAKQFMELSVVRNIAAL
jgi:hypothetical protein